MSCAWFELPADRVDAQVVVVPFFENEKPLRDSQALLDWRLNGILTSMLLKNQVSGKPGERVLVNGGSKIAAPWVMFIGAGERRDLLFEKLNHLLSEAISLCRRAGFFRVGICFGDLAQVLRDELSEVARQHLNEPLYQEMECLLIAFSPVRSSAD
jgi:hypothetical protein